MLTTPLPHLDAWTHYLSTAPLPVLWSTVDELAVLANIEEAQGTVDAHLIGEAIEGDPFMTVKLLSYLGTHRGNKQTGDAETPVAGVMMMGIGPFFREFTLLESVERVLADHPDALAGMKKVLTQANRAARFALGFAIHRLDSDATAVHEATLLHSIAELLLWIHAPSLATTLHARKLADPSVHSADLQQEILNVRLDELQHALMKAWRMPELLIQLTDPSTQHALIATQRSMVQLAVRLTRHSAVDWLNPEVPDDVRDIAELLTLSTTATQRLLHKLDD